MNLSFMKEEALLYFKENLNILARFSTERRFVAQTAAKQQNEKQLLR